MYKRISFIVVAFLMLIASGANARSWYVEPQLNLSAGYDDNPRLESDLDPNIDGLRTDGGPLVYAGGDIRLGSETDSDLLAFDFAVLVRRYDNSPELDSEYFRAAVLYQKAGIRNDFGIDAGVLTDSTFETELNDTGRLNSDVDRQEAYIRPTLTTRFSPLWSGDFALGYRDVTYDASTDDAGFDNFVDFEDFDGSFQLNRRVSERFSVFGLLEFLQYRPTESLGRIGLEKDDFKSVQLGLDYNLGEQLIFSLSAGRGYTDTDLVELEETIEYDTPIYAAGLEYTGQRNTIGADYSRTFESSGGGSLRLTQRFTFTWSRLRTLGATLSFPVSYINRDPDRADTVGVIAGTRDYYELAPSLDWEISQNLFLSALLRYRQEEIGISVSDVARDSDSTAIIFGVRYDFGRKRISY